MITTGIALMVTPAMACPRGALCSPRVRNATRLRMKPTMAMTAPTGLSRNRLRMVTTHAMIPRTVPVVAMLCPGAFTRAVT